MKSPKFLYHKVLGGRDKPGQYENIELALGQIMKQGLRPMRSEEWFNLLPETIRELPVVWMAELATKKGQWLCINTDKLNRKLLFKLEVNDVEWWVYQGHIPISAIQEKTIL